MKNKKLIYILLPASVLIWGFIILKIFLKVRKPIKEFQMRQSEVRAGENTLSKDTFTLIADYRDPFLGNLTTAVKLVVKKETEKAFKPRKEPVRNIPWPEIVYNGTIINNRDDRYTGLIRIDNVDFLVHKGDLIKEIVFIDIYPDSIKAVYQNETKTILKMQ